METENREHISQISVQMEDLAYKISHLEEEVAKLFAYMEEINKGENDDIRRMVTE